ncbi:MAG TPA: hypothetical protein VGB39_01770 [Sphingomicrobium sp.]
MKINLAGGASGVRPIDERIDNPLTGRDQRPGRAADYGTRNVRDGVESGHQPERSG